ncbi:MAG: hypothetical protein ABIP90_09070 [Vicinamibacterales bacterium]
MIEAKGQTNLTVVGNANQVEAQAAYGISDAVALQVNFGRVQPKKEDNGNSGSGRLFEAGLGYFRHVRPSVLFDVYALAGVGTVDNDFPSALAGNPGTTGKISADMTRFSLQPSISFQRRRVSISGSTRLSSLQYRNIEGSLIFGGENQVKYLTDNKSNFLVEPAVTLRVGGEKLRLQVQIVRSVNLSNSDFKQDKSLGTVGLNFNFR